MSFVTFSKAVERRFSALSEHELFEVEVTDLFEQYLAAFPTGTNPIYRTNTEHHCSCCRQFVKNLGNVVAIKNGRIETVWEDLGVLPAPYGTVARRLDEVVRAAPIRGIFRTTEARFGVASNLELKTGITYNHFVGQVRPHHTRTAAAIGDASTTAQVLRRGLEELTLGALDDVLNLIDAKMLYRGEDNKHAVRAFRDLKVGYDAAPNKDLFVWSHIQASVAKNKFRNTAIGTLVVDLSAGVPIEDAVKSFEAKVAPQNYQRTTAVITPRMVENAVEALRSAGLEPAIERRFARLSDVSVGNVLFVDNAVRSKMKGNLTDLLMAEVRQPASTKNAVAVSVEEFFGTVLPTAKSLDLLVENRHAGNFMSVTAPVHTDAKPLFKWDNGFAWSYDGDVADSIKQRVKRAGGNVETALRVSLAWFNSDDLDLHANTPSNKHVYFGAKQGILDVDMNAHSITPDPVENLAFEKLEDGVYRIAVHQFNQREKTGVGFTLEVASAGILRQFSYSRELRAQEKIEVLQITVKNKIVTDIRVHESLVEGASSSEKWGIKTETLVPVDTVMLSPNRWDGREVGACHWFFLLKDCKNPDEARGFYNEFLHPDLQPHRKVLEVLGNKMKCPRSDEQLSGLGFTAARGDSVTVVVRTDKQARPYTINF